MLRGFLVDVTGHDLSTALHIASMHVLLREINERDLPLSDAMRWLNHRVAEYFAEGFFAGTLGFELDLQTRDLRWVCAGIPKIMAEETGRIPMMLSMSHKMMYNSEGTEVLLAWRQGNSAEYIEGDNTWAK